jgi:hypothetical protein
MGVAVSNPQPKSTHEAPDEAGALRVPESRRESHRRLVAKLRAKARYRLESAAQHAHAPELRARIETDARTYTEAADALARRWGLS